MQSIIKALSIICIIIASAIAVFTFSADCRSLAIYCAFLLFYVLLPGAAIMQNLRFDNLHRSTFIIRSFFIGFALNIILYYAATLIDSDILLYACGPLLSVLLIVRILRDGPESFISACKQTVSAAPAAFYVTCALVFISSMLMTQYMYMSPADSAFSFMKIDFAYHAGIVNSLALGYPPQDPWVYDLSIAYHFFSEMLMSIPVRLFNLPSEELILGGTPYLIAPVLTLAFYSFFKEFSSKPERAGLYCLSLPLSNMFILKQFAYSWFLYHLYSNINNAGTALACFLTALPLLKTWDRNSDSDKTRFNTKEMLLLAVFVMLLTGMKGPMAAVLVGGVVGTLMLGVILRKVDMRSFALVVLTGISFVLVYIYVLGAQHSNTTGGALLNLGEVTDLFFFKDNVMGLGLPKPVAWLLLFGVFSVFLLTAFFLPFVIGYLRELILVISGRKKFLFSKVSIYACCLVGFIALMLLDFNGNSQVYFGFVSCALVPIISFWFLEDIEESKTSAAKLVRLAFAAAVCLFACTYALYIVESVGSSVDFYDNHNEPTHKYRNVSAAEYEGLIWIRDNTPEDSLVASDRYYSVALDKYDYKERGSNTHFAYAVYSKRNQYLEGSGFSIGAGGYGRRRNMLKNNAVMYDPADESRGDVAREYGVDYLIVSKRFNKVGDLRNEDYELCFSNDEMDIYEIKEAS